MNIIIIHLKCSVFLTLPAPICTENRIRYFHLLRSFLVPEVPAFVKGLFFALSVFGNLAKSQLFLDFLEKFEKIKKYPKFHNFFFVGMLIAVPSVCGCWSCYYRHFTICGSELTFYTIPVVFFTFGVVNLKELGNIRYFKHIFTLYIIATKAIAFSGIWLIQLGTY